MYYYTMYWLLYFVARGEKRPDRTVVALLVLFGAIKKNTLLRGESCIVRRRDQNVVPKILSTRAGTGAGLLETASQLLVLARTDRSSSLQKNCVDSEFLRLM